MRIYTVTRDHGGQHEQKTVYKHFDTQFLNSAGRFDLPSDLGVGPFYCDAGDFDRAEKEIWRYVRNEWGRKRTDIRFTALK